MVTQLGEMCNHNKASSQAYREVLWLIKESKEIPFDQLLEYPNRHLTKNDLVIRNQSLVVVQK